MPRNPIKVAPSLDSMQKAAAHDAAHDEDHDPVEFLLEGDRLMKVVILKMVSTDKAADCWFIEGWIHGTINNGNRFGFPAHQMPYTGYVSTNKENPGYLIIDLVVH